MHVRRCIVYVISKTPWTLEHCLSKAALKRHRQVTGMEALVPIIQCQVTALGFQVFARPFRRFLQELQASQHHKDYCREIYRRFITIK